MILTEDVQGALKKHHCMPVFLEENSVEDWIESKNGSAKPILNIYELTRSRKVSTKVVSSENEAPDVIEPI